MKATGSIATFAPHELALHLSHLLQILPQSDLRPVRMAMEQAINLLRIATSTVIDMKHSDCGISFAIGVEKNHSDEKVKAAARLLRVCLHAVEDGNVSEQSRPIMLMELAAMSGYVPDQQRRNASKPRPKKSAEDALDRGIRDVLKGDPELTWKQLADRLYDLGIVVTWDEAKLTFTNGESDGEKTISTGTYRTRLGKLKKALKQSCFSRNGLGVNAQKQ